MGKTLIFNNGINTSLYVYETFRAGYPIRHLDNTSSTEERKDILQWFKKHPMQLTSVGILTTGFDEPTVDTIILIGPPQIIDFILPNDWSWFKKITK
jgi:superfamily II DNA or RNA helicase